MRIQERFAARNATALGAYRYIDRSGLQEERTESVLSEQRFCISVHGQKRLETVCLPELLPELVLGRLLTEGWIAGAADVEEIVLTEAGAEVSLRESAAERRAIQPVGPAEWETAWMFALADRFAQGMPLHRKTFATHSCFLAQGDRLLFACEDIGRHNALDKAVGYALRHGIDLGTCLLYSSGRVPVDMVQKAARAGVPVLASKGSPTIEAVELAKQCGMVLVCAARQDRMKQFAGPAPRDG